MTTEKPKAQSTSHVGSTLPKKGGYASMKDWDKSWKQHHIPMWAKKALRLNAKKNGTLRRTEAVYGLYFQAKAFLPHDLFDHYGSVQRNGVRVLVTQPYGDHNDLAAKFANEMGWSVRFFTPGPWNEGTWCYEFLPRDAEPSE